MSAKLLKFFKTCFKKALDKNLLGHGRSDEEIFEPGLKLEGLEHEKVTSPCNTQDKTE